MQKQNKSVFQKQENIQTKQNLRGRSRARSKGESDNAKGRGGGEVWVATCFLSAASDPTYPRRVHYTRMKTPGPQDSARPHPCWVEPYELQARVVQAVQPQMLPLPEGGSGRGIASFSAVKPSGGEPVGSVRFAALGVRMPTSSATSPRVLEGRFSLAAFARMPSALPVVTGFRWPRLRKRVSKQMELSPSGAFRTACCSDQLLSIAHSLVMFCSTGTWGKSPIRPQGIMSKGLRQLTTPLEHTISTNSHAHAHTTKKTFASSRPLLQ